MAEISAAKEELTQAKLKHHEVKERLDLQQSGEARMISEMASIKDQNQKLRDSLDCNERRLLKSLELVELQVSVHGKNRHIDQLGHCGLPSVAMAVSQAKMLEKILKTNKRAEPAVTDEALDKLKMDAQ